MAIHSIELCAGVGMLGEGVRAGFEFLGIHHRTVCYVEREAPAAAQLAALMEAGALDPAPVWSDLLTFDGAAWRGRVDCVIAGFPCQDLSIAGRRAGLNAKRSGLFFRVVDIADDCNAQYLILENVAGIATATASVVDEEEGELEERSAARVLGELADRGWDAEWITLSASDVGASHGRARWFCFAWRQELADAGGVPAGQGLHAGRWPEGGGATCTCGTSGAMAHAECAERRPECVGRNGCIQGHDGGRREADGGPGVADAALAVSPGDGWNEGRPESGGEQGRPHAAVSGCAVADASGAGCEGRELGRACLGNRGGAEAHGPTSQLRGALPIFALGPSDPAWAGILARRPDLAPAVEPGVRLLVDGMAGVLDESRSHQLRQVGNGVVPLCAATALVQLVRRAGMSE